MAPKEILGSLRDYFILDCELFRKDDSAGLDYTESYLLLNHLVQLMLSRLVEQVSIT